MEMQLPCWRWLRILYGNEFYSSIDKDYIIKDTSKLDLNVFASIEKDFIKIVILFGHVYGIQIFVIFLIFQVKK